MSDYNVKGFLNSRLGWDKIFQHLVPAHTNNFAYTIGGTLIVLGILQGITGVILQQFYNPMPGADGAYDSIVTMMNSAEISFLRSLHYWGSQIMVFLVLLHLIRVFVTDSYKKPRELQWIAGIILLLLLFGLTFSGTVLKMDQEAVEAIEHQTEAAETIGSVGSLFSSQFAPEVPLLARLYAAHVTVLPAITIPVLGVHLLLVRLLGISIPIIKKDGKLIPAATKTTSFSLHVKRMIIYGLIAVVVTMIISIIIPAPLGMQGMEGIEITKPPWYLLWIFPLEDAFGIGSVPVVSVIIVAIIASVPLFNRTPHTNHRTKKLMIVAMFALIAIFIGLMIGGAIVPIGSHF
jgi:ubiquinol-cytochrome c reductase cytochrome b subunit